MGRPKIYTPERIAEIAAALIAWSKLDDSFYIAKFCNDNELWRQRLTELAEIDEDFSDALKRAHNACEFRLATAAAKGEIPCAFGIFALKQHDWTDKTEIGGMKNKPIEFKGLNESDLESRIAQLIGKAGTPVASGREGEASEAT